MAKGSARILATSKELACKAFLADTGNAPPTSMAQLTIIAKIPSPPPESHGQRRTSAGCRLP